MIKNKKYYLILLIFTGYFVSCSDNTIVPDNGTLLFEKQGLVDSVVVFGCYSQYRIFSVPDTLSLAGYSNLKVEFDGNVNSNGTFITVNVTSLNNENTEFYKVRDMAEINKQHSFQAPPPYQESIISVLLYINPPVCGQNEFKYNRIRDLKIYGVK